MLRRSASAILAGLSPFFMRSMLTIVRVPCKRSDADADPSRSRFLPALPVLAPPAGAGLRPADRGGDRDGGGPAVPAGDRRPADPHRRARGDPRLVSAIAGTGGVGVFRQLLAARRADRGHAAMAYPVDWPRRRQPFPAAGPAAAAGGRSADAAADAGADAGIAHHAVDLAGGMGRVVRAGPGRSASTRAARHRRRDRAAPAGLNFTWRSAPARFNPAMPPARPAQNRSDAELIRSNRGFYESLWAQAKLIDPARFNTWPLLHELAQRAPRRLEVAPGLRPRLPLQGTCFVDLSVAAL